MWSVCKLAARAAIWRTTPDPPPVGLATLLGWALILAAVRVGLQYAADAGEALHFNPYGLNAMTAWLALELAAAAFFVAPPDRCAALATMCVLSALGTIATAAFELGAPFVAEAAKLDDFGARTIPASAAAAVQAWWLGAMACVLASLAPQPRWRLFGRVAALWAALFIAHSVVPNAPVFVPPDFDIRNANWWEYLHARYGSGREAARIEQAQTALLKDEIDHLAPRHDGTNVYALGLAGVDQGVFVKELDGALTALATVFPLKDHTLRLINNHETATRVPLASPQNLAAALHAIASAMKKDDDVLVLVMTSHGDQQGVALQLPGQGPAELTPDEVAAALDREAIKNRVVIVSACFSGIFLPPLQNDNTIVMTASDDKNTSFGCAPERDWTYFGDALFRQSLQAGADLQQAFDHARVLIHGWELMDRLPPSNPQASFGPALVKKLAPFFAAASGAKQ